MSLSDKIDFFPIEHTTYQKTLPQLSKTVPSNFGWYTDKYLSLLGGERCKKKCLDFPVYSVITHFCFRGKRSKERLFDPNSNYKGHWTSVS